MATCLIKNNPKVAASLDELTAALGNEDAAYAALSHNNGYSFDFNSDGSLNTEFSDLVLALNGDRNEALRVYSLLALAKREIPEQQVAESYGVLKLMDSGKSEFTISEAIDSVKPFTTDETRDLTEMFSNLNADTKIVLADSLPDSVKLSSHIKEEDWQFVEGVYDSKTDTIYLNTSRITDYDGLRLLSVMLHEMVHSRVAISVWRILNDLPTATDEEKAVFSAANLLFEHYRSILADKVGLNDLWYGLDDVNEFVAEIFSNPRFLEKLNEIAYLRDANFIDKAIYLIKLFVNKFVKLFDLSKYNDQLLEQIKDQIFQLMTVDLSSPVTAVSRLNLRADYNYMKQVLPKMTKEAGEKVNADNLEVLKEELKDVQDMIVQAHNERLKVYKNADKEVQASVKNEMDYQISNIALSVSTDIERIENFLIFMLRELDRIERVFDLAKELDVPVSPKDLTDFKLTFFDTYDGIFNAFGQTLSRDDAYADLLNGDEYKKKNKSLNTLKEHFETVETKYRSLSYELLAHLSDTATSIIATVGIASGRFQDADVAFEVAKANEKDITYATALALSMDKVNNTVLKTIFLLITSADQKARLKHFERIHKFQKLVRAAGKYNLFKLFELYDDGTKTGYLVRSRNYGKFEKDFEDACNQICTDLGVPRADLGLPKNREIRIEFNRRKNEWLSKHCERRMTEEYYNAFNALSDETQLQRLAIQTKINNILNRYRDEFGRPHLEKMTDEEMRQYKDYRLLLRELASKYYLNGFKKQDGSVELLVAEELTELNKKLAEGLRMKKDVATWEKERAKAKKELTPEQFERWEWANSIERIDESFYEELSKIERKTYNDDYADISEAIRAILNMFRDPVTGETDIDALKNSSGTMDVLEQYYKMQAHARANAIKHKKTKILNEGSKKFSDIAEYVPTKRWLEDYNEYYIKRITEVGFDENGNFLGSGNIDEANRWIEKNAYLEKYIDAETGEEKTRWVPKIWYTKLQPKNKSLIHVEPNNFWGELSEESSLVNKEFLRLLEEDPSLKDEFLIPKKEVTEEDGTVKSYDNTEAYNRIISNKDLKALYDAIILEIKDSTDGMSNILRTYPYRIPARAGNFWTYFIAGFKRNGVAGILKAIRDYFIDKLGTRANDVEGLHTQSRIKAIPQYYLGSLYDTAYTANDLVETVLLFADSCTKWKEKTEILPRIETLREYLKSQKSFTGSKLTKDKKKGEISNVYKMALDYINRNLYDNQVTNYQTNIRGITVNWSKMAGVLRALGTVYNLGLNVACAGRGLVTASWAHMINTLVGRYYNLEDATSAFFRILWDLLTSAAHVIGLSNYETTTSKFMQLFGIGAEMEYDMLLYPKGLRSLKKHLFFGPYTLFDHFVKGLILLSIMNNFRLVTDENGNKTFMCREDYLKKHGRPKMFSKEYTDFFKLVIFNDKPSFYSCIEFNGGKLVAKDPELQELVDKYSPIIGQIALKLAQEADGLLTKLLRPMYLGNVFGTFIGMYRQYMPVNIQNRYSSARQYDYQMLRERESMFLTLYACLPNKILEESAVLTATKLDRMKQAAKALGKKYSSDPVTRENIRKFCIEGSLLIALNSICVPLLQGWADRDRDNFLKQLTAMILEGSIFEIGVLYNPTDLYSLVKSISAISALLESYGAMLSFIPQFYEINLEDKRIRKNLEESLKYAEENGYYGTANEIRKELNGKPHKKVIKTGAYAGKTQLQRNLIKLMPGHSLYELIKDPATKREAYKRYVIGNAKNYN